MNKSRQNGRPAITMLVVAAHIAVGTLVGCSGTSQDAASKDGYGIIMTYTAGDRPGTTRITYSVRNQRGGR